MKKPTVISIIWIVLGAPLFVLGAAEIIEPIWGSIGSTLILIGCLQLFRAHRIRKNPAYKEKLEIESADERLRFIRSKAWAWAGYWFVILASLSCIALQVAGQKLLATAAGLAVCLIITLYWISYWMLKKRY